MSLGLDRTSSAPRQATPVSRWVEDDQVERVIHASALTAIGVLQSPPHSGYFTGEHLVTNYLVAFPRSTLWIHQDRGRRFVADPTVATIYNRGQVLRRAPIGTEGDVGEWLAVAEPIAREVVAAHDPAAAAGPSPLRFTNAPVSARLYRRQRTLTRLVRRGEADPLLVDESVITLFGEVIAASYQAQGREALVTGGAPQRRQLVDRAREFLAATYRSNLGVTEIAHACDTSVYHLCRVFRLHTGQTLHGYRRDLRLRVALGQVGRYRGDLARLAIDLGFFSHSHFTGSFSRQFGMSPASWDSASAQLPV